MTEELLTPELRYVLDYMKTKPCEWLSVRDVRIALEVTNGAARYRLGRLAELDLIKTYITWITRPYIRRRSFHYIPPEELVADEGCTGYNIYFDATTKKYAIRDPDTHELIREEDKICLELTASIKTGGGHDRPVVVEITCTCYVKEMSLSDLISAEKKVESALREWLISEGWGNLIHAFMKEGVLYNGEKHVDARALYPWTVPNYPNVHVFVEKKKPREAKYEGDFKVEE